MNASAFIKKPVPAPGDPLIFPPNMDYRYMEGSSSHPFNKRARGFDFCNAWWFAELSLASYEHPGFIRLLFRSIGMDMRAFIKGSTAGFVAFDDTRVFVVYRGTQVKNSGAISDILIDMKFPPEPVPGGGAAHGGFYSAFTSIWDGTEGIHAFLDELVSLKKGRGVWFTGHSMGAAIATLSYAWYPQAAGLYTFGSPKVGDDAFCRTLGKRFYNIVAREDIIPRLPPRIPALRDFPGNRFVHGGEMWVLNHDDTVVRRELDGGEFGEIWKKNLDGMRSKVMDLIFRRKQGGSGLSGLHRAFSSYVLRDIALHAPVFYAIGCWNAYCEKNLDTIHLKKTSEANHAK
jgi:triacylglycerol lipase